MAHTQPSTYLQRLQTFQGFWDDDFATARQLAAIGHVCDRPPLEALDEGSHCVDCNAFVRRGVSVKALDGDNTPGSYVRGFGDFNFHNPSCIRLQVRIPLEPQSQMGLYGYSMRDVRAKWASRIAAQDRPQPTSRASQSSSLFSLPTELRLEIYRQILPEITAHEPIMQLNRDSARVITAKGFHMTGPLKTTKANLLRTCRAVHAEASDLLYAHTTFSFQGRDGTKILYLFLRNIGQAGRDLIKSVDVQWGNREDAMAFALLASCPKLQTLTLRLPRPMLLFPGPPLWCIDGVSCLLALSGLQKVTFEGARDPNANYLKETSRDAAKVRDILSRPKDSPADMSIIDRYITGPAS